MTRIPDNAMRVNEWMTQVPSLPAEEVIEAFERGVNAVWRRCLASVGESTLRAVLRQVLADAAHHFPILTPAMVDRNGGIVVTDLRRCARAEDVEQLREGTRYVLIRFLDVVGYLTPDDPAPALHAALAEAFDGRPRRPM